MNIEIPAHIQEKLRAPSFRARQWLDGVQHDLSQILQAAGVAAESFETRRLILLEMEQTAESEFSGRVLEKAVDLGLGEFDSEASLASRVFNQGYEDQPRTAEYALLAYWSCLQDEMYWPRHEHEGSDAHRLYMGALAIAMHSVLEQALDRFGVMVHECRPKAVTIGDFKEERSGKVAKHRRYLEKVHAVDLEDRLWNRASGLRHVRNLFAHHLGRCAKGHEHLGAVRKLPGISLKDSDSAAEELDVEVSRVYLEYCRDVVSDLSAALSASVTAWDRPRAVVYRKTGISEPA